MSWGAANADPCVPLNYASLDAALLKRKLNNRVRKKDELPVYQNYVTARRDGECIALKLYNTDIATFRPDGAVVLRGEGWMYSQITTAWLDECTGYRMRSWAGDRWNERVWHINGSKFYDGIVVRGDELLSKREPVLKKAPNAEAKQLRKDLTKLLAFYKPYIKLVTKVERVVLDGNYIWQAMREVVDGTHTMNPSLMWAMLCRAFNERDLFPVAQKYVVMKYEQAVDRRKLFDQVEVNRTGESNV